MTTQVGPILMDLTIANITPNTNRINAQCKDPRLAYLMERLVTHMHDFARETRLSTEEWTAALGFLVGCGKISSDVRHEFILLSDVLGLSLLIDSINHPKPPASTESSLLGPFHAEAPELELGGSMSSDPDGEPLLCLCTVKDTSSMPLQGVKIDIWGTDSHGLYDVQREAEGSDVPHERCILESDHNGLFWFKSIKPVSYRIPDDGPVGKMLERLGRHAWRPAHLHFMLKKAGMDELTTALYLRGDPYETSDAVFGVKESLVVDLDRVDKATAEKYGVEEGIWLLTYDFVLATEDETMKLRDTNAVEALEKLNLRLKLIDHLPVPDLD
ncbi:dioxygenase [Dactylonectria macrodidyma]|uniref:Dioxygenase n=1 Tax=Dactylonectria macrodidyma TaxID=307937 RepID=A0A9P9DC76_9HYPO|nr:dioxygenase [Dactylonectria macrodidyma]